MKGKHILTILLIFIFYILGTLSIVDADIELAYDDGEPEEGWGAALGILYGVRFVPPCMPIRVLATRFELDIPAPPEEIIIRIFDSGYNEIVSPITASGLVDGWNEVDLTSHNIVVTGPFIIALDWGPGTPPATIAWLGFDTDGDGTRSWIYRPGEGWKTVAEETPGGPEGNVGNWLIRAVIDDCPVGGRLIPTNTRAYACLVMLAVIIVSGATITRVYR